MVDKIFHKEMGSFHNAHLVTKGSCVGGVGGEEGGGRGWEWVG